MRETKLQIAKRAVRPVKDVKATPKNDDAVSNEKEQSEYDLTDFDNLSFANKTFNVPNKRQFSEFLTLNTPAVSNTNTLANLREKLQQKRSESKKQQDGFSKTTTDSFNMTLMKGFGATDGGQGRPSRAPLLPDKERKLQMSKTQKNFVVNRYRSHKDISKDKYYMQRAPPPPLGRTFGHGLFRNPSQPKI